MTTNAGVWIDYHKAVVVFVTRELEDFVQITSGHDPIAHSPGGAKVKTAYTRADFVSEDKRHRESTSRLNEYYDKVIACLGDAEAVLVMGPGEAKGEFAKRFRHAKTKGRITHLETVDKLTDREIAAHVRELLGIECPRSRPTNA